MALAKDFRVCRKCHKRNLKSEFPLSFTGNENGGRRLGCIECGYKPFDAKLVGEYSNTVRDRVLYIKECKNQPCADCGIQYPEECMDFDHIPERGKKNFTIGWSHRQENIEILKLEVEKCEVVCANCHRIRTKQRKKNRKNYE